MDLSLAAHVEAILYLKGQPLKASEIAEYALVDREKVEDALIDLMDAYAHRDSALEIVETKAGYALQLRGGLQDLVQRIVPVDLSVGELRSLAAIALQGGISQTKLIEVRGSGAYDHVKELVLQGFVRKRRLKDSRSFWLQVTEKFHQYFEIDRLPQPFDSGSEQIPLEFEEDEPPTFEEDGEGSESMGESADGAEVSET
jgi:segregation and condensation protein B